MRIPAKRSKENEFMRQHLEQEEEDENRTSERFCGH